METIPIPTIERPAFFEGQRLTADDLAAAVEYERELRALHNRALHGWGIAQGFAVTGERGATSVTVRPGYALDCAGREIVLAHSVELAIPPVAAPTVWYLAVSYATDDELAPEERSGVCGTAGAVRLRDEPLIRWLDARGKGEVRVRPGLDLVLALATVRGCRLDQPLGFGARHQLAQPQPYVFAARTEAGGTTWEAWKEGKDAGVQTTVSTAAAGFLATPVYQARLAGSRVLTGKEVVDGIGTIVGASADSFVFRVTLPSHQDLRVTGPTGGGLKLNSTVAVNVLRTELQWHVVWMGVEST